MAYRLLDNFLDIWKFTMEFTTLYQGFFQKLNLGTGRLYNIFYSQFRAFFFHDEVLLLMVS